MRLFIRIFIQTAIMNRHLNTRYQNSYLPTMKPIVRRGCQGQRQQQRNCHNVKARVTVLDRRDMITSHHNYPWQVSLLHTHCHIHYIVNLHGLAMANPSRICCHDHNRSRRYCVVLHCNLPCFTTVPAPLRQAKRRRQGPCAAAPTSEPTRPRARGQCRA